MRVIPVIDLMRGQVVRGVAGRREAYRPIESCLCDSARPVEVAAMLARRFGFRELYVADLDAIAGGEPAWATYAELASHVPHLLVDAGVRDKRQAGRLAEFDASSDGQNGLAAVIAGLESVPSPEVLAEILTVVGRERLVFSLDLKAGRPLGDATVWRSHDAWGVALAAIDVGLRRLIVLDLARVGMHDGVGTEGFCRRLRARDAGIEIIAGGGVRGREDLQALATAGCDAALVASALHDGRLSENDVRGGTP